MSDTPTPANMPATAPTMAPSAPEDAPGFDGLPERTQAEIKSLRAEAAKYRTALREAEAERDALRGEVADIRQRQALDAVADLLDDPDDLGRHLDLTTLVDDAGNADPAKYREAAEKLAAERPRLAPVPGPPASSGTTPEASSGPTPWHAPDADPGEIMSTLMRGEM